MKAVDLSLKGHLWPLAALIVTLLIAANGGKLGSKLLMDAHFDGTRFPVKAVDYLDKYEVKRPVLSPDYWGGYLIYRLHPKTLVVLDDRHDLYGEEFFKSYLKMVRVEPGWEGFLQAHAISCVLVPKDAPLTNILVETSDWKVTYADEMAVLLVRLSSSRR